MHTTRHAVQSAPANKIIHGSQHFPKTKFPGFSLSKSLNSMRFVITQSAQNFSGGHRIYASKSQKYYPDLSFWISVQIPWVSPDFCCFSQIPCLEKVKLIFKVFPDFQNRWEPCYKTSGHNFIIIKSQRAVYQWFILIFTNHSKII